MYIHVHTYNTLTYHTYVLVHGLINRPIRDVFFFCAKKKKINKSKKKDRAGPYIWAARKRNIKNEKKPHTQREIPQKKKKKKKIDSAWG